MSAGAPANAPKSLLVVRLGAMGDVIHTMHAVAVLRHALAETRIGWVIEERWADLLCARGTPRSGARSAGRPLVDFVHVVNTKAWRKVPLANETRRQFSAALTEIRDQKYELAIDFQGAIKSALLARISRPKTLFGMDEPRETPARLFYSQRVQTKGSHVIEQYCSLGEAVLVRLNRRASLDRTAEGGCPCANLNASGDVLPRDTAAEQVIADKLHNINAPIVLINPGAGWGAKEWPSERYGEISWGLAKEGASVLVNYGPGEEQLAKDVQDSSGGVAQPITCSIAELIALTRRAKLFIGGDTGPLHLAAAMDVPLVAIFGPTDPARNGPFSKNSIVLRNPASRTSLSHTSNSDPGLLQIMPDEVLAAARKLLESNHA
ncbi:MAG TPA: glycosyltransferase family 9 protein [Terriglobales bacterium]|nr:glycosyltransferase family 9 protein [Terriglobales bacterium]